MDLESRLSGFIINSAPGGLSNQYGPDSQRSGSRLPSQPVTAPGNADFRESPAHVCSSTVAMVGGFGTKTAPRLNVLTVCSSRPKYELAGYCCLARRHLSIISLVHP